MRRIRVSNRSRAFVRGMGISTLLVQSAVGQSPEPSTDGMPQADSALSPAAETVEDVKDVETAEPIPGEMPQVSPANAEDDAPPPSTEPKDVDVLEESSKAPRAAAQEPYEGLDHSGSPPPPPKESSDPEGQWSESYDGRRKKKRAEDTLIWIPRAPLLPAHLLLNYGVRWPIVTAITKAEEVRFFHRAKDFFTFADGDAGVFPIGFFDKGRGLWGGAHFFYQNLGREGHTVRATAGIGTNDWILTTLTDSWTVFDGETGNLRFNASYIKDPTFAFTGLGPETNIEDEVFFSEERASVAVGLDVGWKNLSRFSTELSYKHARLKESGRDPAIAGSPFDPSFTTTTGFQAWYDLASLSLRLELDSRSPERQFTPGSGVRWEIWGNYHLGSADELLSYFRYGTHPGVLWDFTGRNHVLSLSTTLEALSKTGGGGPPLSETISLGGADLMKAFLPGRFRGQSTLVHSIAYTWPVLAYADVMLFSDLGNAFLGFYDDFSYDKLALDWGTGLRTSFSRDLRAELLFAWGSNQMNRWEDEFSVDNFRFVAGVGRGF